MRLLILCPPLFLGVVQGFVDISPPKATTNTKISNPSAQIFPNTNEVPSKISLQMTSSESDNSDSSTAAPFKLPNRSRRTQHKDTVIIGSGLAGLSAALYLSQVDPDRHITIVDKQSHDIEAKRKTTVSSFAAAGMLAPQSERLPRGPLLDMCLESRRMYPEFCDMVESMAKESGEEGAKYLWHGNNSDDNNNSGNLDKWSVGYMASGGFLAPAFAGDTVATWSPPDENGSATWLDEIQVRELEPSLHPDVVGGWWFAEDASVDARRLTCSLHAACIAAGVQFSCGEAFEVTSLDLNDGKCHGLWLQNGHYLKTKSVLVANGAWMRNLLPVPIEPHKGQSLSLKMPKDRPPILRRVLFAQDSYIVPKADGHIVIGATVEAGSFDGNVTPAGILHILTHALQLVPGLKDLPIVETWAGLRPTTPDKGPILGKSPWKNLFLAGGYWRNGVLLAPKTAQLLACLMTETDMTPEDEELLAAFSWDRFTRKGGGAALAANARYAASMHPIHSRVSGAGVAASVGTELGSYSTAKAAKEERQKDRNAMFGDGASGDDAFERAAALGRRDATTFSMSGGNKAVKAKESTSPTFFPETPAPTLPKAKVSTQKEEASDNDMASVYQSIKDNKAKKVVSLPDDDGLEDRPDPGFRVHHIDAKTGESREVPPYTNPGAFIESLNKEKAGPICTDEADTEPIGGAKEESYNEQTYDGYQAIQNANAGKSRAEELESMRKARMSNRLDQSDIDESKIGAHVMEVIEDAPETERVNGANATESSDVASAYKTIMNNKSKKNLSLRDSSGLEEARADPGFRIFHVDAKTGEKREVPPYTTPGEFLQSLKKEASDTANGKEKANGKTEPQIKSEGINGVTSKEKKLEHSGINGDTTSEYSETTYVPSLQNHVSLENDIDRLYRKSMIALTSTVVLTAACLFVSIP